MKILLLADREEKALWDFWSDERKESLKDISLILSAGDLRAEYLEFLVTMLNVPLVYVRGNHDAPYQKRPPEGCIDADGSLVEVECTDMRMPGSERDVIRVRILGMGGSMRYRPGPPDMYTENEMRRRLNSAFINSFASAAPMRRGFDILLTHAPARDHGDMDDPAHRGFECFNDILNKYRPALHCFGHVHQEYGDFERESIHPSGTVLINACGCCVRELTV